MDTTLPEFELRFEPMTIEHLGLRLYSTLPPVISELVSNAYDADSLRADVDLPTGQIDPSSEVVVRDYGHGLSPDELQSHFLPIGRPRRGVDSKDVLSRSGKRRVTGRKGLGKLSAFGIAAEMEVQAISEGFAVCLRLNYDEMHKQAADHPEQPYRPDVVEDRTGPTKEPNGVEVRLRGLRRKRQINPDDVRRGLARRLGFIGANFEVFVNGSPIGPQDTIQRTECPADFRWDLAEVPAGNTVPAPDGEGKGYKVEGWIGFLDRSSQTARGVDIFATAKAVELNSYFNFPSTHAQFARAHLVGQVQADFLDQDQDLISTARNSVVWESEIGQNFQLWGQKLLTWAFGRWVQLRKQRKEDRIIKQGGFDEWLKTRQESEQRIARRLVRLLIDDDDLDADSAVPLLEIVKGSVETVAFRELVEAMSDKGITVPKMLELFAEWRIIEAREHLRLADGRKEAVAQLTKFMDQGALEVKELQPLFEQNPWMLDATWSEVDSQPTFTRLLRERFKEKDTVPEINRRLDLFAISAGATVTVVELKHPKKKLSKDDLNQLEDYVDFVRGHLKGTGPGSYSLVTGILIVGEMNPEVRDKVNRLAAHNMRVEVFDDVRRRAESYYAAAEKNLARLAPEYVRWREKKGDE